MVTSNRASLLHCDARLSDALLLHERAGAVLVEAPLQHADLCLSPSECLCLWSEQQLQVLPAADVPGLARHAPLAPCLCRCQQGAEHWLAGSQAGRAGCTGCKPTEACGAGSLRRLAGERQEAAREAACVCQLRIRPHTCRRPGQRSLPARSGARGAHPVATSLCPGCRLQRAGLSVHGCNSGARPSQLQHLDS